MDLPLKNQPGNAPATAIVSRSDTPGKTPVVFLHGWLMDAGIWDDVIARLPQDREYLAVTQPAHGATPGPGEDFSMADWADWLSAILEVSGIDRCILVGHSMGGILVQEFASRHGEKVAGLCLIGAHSGEWSPEEQQFLVGAAHQVGTAWSPELAGQIGFVLLGQTFLSQHPGFLPAWADKVATYDRAAMHRLAAAYAGRASHDAMLSAAGFPVLLLHGVEDPGIPAAKLERSAALTRNGRLVLIEKSGHCPPLEQPAETAGAIAMLLADADGGA